MCRASLGELNIAQVHILKPGSRRNLTGPQQGLPWGGLEVHHVMTREEAGEVHRGLRSERLDNPIAKLLDV